MAITLHLKLFDTGVLSAYRKLDVRGDWPTLAARAGLKPELELAA